MMTPTGKADTQLKEEAQDKSKKRSSSRPTGKSHHIDKETCIREDMSEEDKTRPPRQQAEKINGITEEEQGQKPGHTVWEDIGLTEYNPQTKNGNSDLKIASVRWAPKKQHSTIETDNDQKTTWGETNNNMPILEHDI